MGTGPRQLRAANLGFGKWLQRGTERGEPEGRRPRGWGPSLLSFRSARWQWSRSSTSLFPATGFPGPGLRELRQRAALLGRWLCKIRGHGGGRDSPLPSLSPSGQVILKTEGLTVSQAVSELTVCGEKEETWHCGGREPAAGCGAGRLRLRGAEGEWTGFPASCFEGHISDLALPNRAL